jgi:hypothetical protein
MQDWNSASIGVVETHTPEEGFRHFKAAVSYRHNVAELFNTI